jgi:hypothetical protein
MVRFVYQNVVYTTGHGLHHRVLYTPQARVSPPNVMFAAQTTAYAMMAYALDCTYTSHRCADCIDQTAFPKLQAVKGGSRLRRRKGVRKLMLSAPLLASPHNFNKKRAWFYE